MLLFRRLLQTVRLFLQKKEKLKQKCRELIAESATVEAIDQKTKADSSANEARLSAAEAERQKIVAEGQRKIAVYNATVAQEQKTIAEQQTDSATRAKILAQKNEKIATEQKLEALRLRMLSIGKAMSIKSLQAQGQKDLQTLLAYQAYLFNKKNGGVENDADIYAGLYNVAREYGSSNYKSFTGHKGEIKSIAFVPEQNEFYTSGSDGKILKWSLDSKEQTIQIIYSGTDIIEVLAVSPDASWLACGSGNSTIRMIPLKGNNVGYEMNGHKGKIKSLIFSYDGKYLYSASLDGKVLKWDIAARTNTNVSDGSIQITSIDVSSNGNYLAGISSDGKVIVWNPEDNSDNFSLQTSGKIIKVIRFNPDNNILAIGDVSGSVELWDINLRKKINEVKAHTAQINDIRFNTTLKQMATASSDAKLKLFNIADPTDLTEPPITFSDNNDEFVMVMQFSPDGKLIVSGTYDGDRNIIGRPTNVDYLVKDICSIVSRNMTEEEWDIYVAKDIPLEKTCQEQSYNIKVDAIK